MDLRICLGHLTEDHFEILKTVFFQTPSSDGCAASSLTGFSEGEVYESIVLEIRAQSHVQEPPLSTCVNLRNACQRF